MIQGQVKGWWMIHKQFSMQESKNVFAEAHEDKSADQPAQNLTGPALNLSLSLQKQLAESMSGRLEICLNPGDT